MSDLGSVLRDLQRRVTELESLEYESSSSSLDLKVSAKGEILTYSTVAVALAVGADGLFLKADSAQATGLLWAKPTPLSVKGDLLVFDGADDLALPVGTNGQVLTANTASPYGVSWSTLVGGGGGTSPLTTKGDIFVHNGTADTRLAIGANNTILYASSGEASGMAWGSIQDLIDTVRTTTYWRENVKNNLSATTSPTASNDSTQGYSVNSIWIDTTADTAWICLDNTATAAVWKNIISSTVLTTKGDLNAFSTESTRLAVGVNGQILMADSAEDAGLIWIDELSSGDGVLVDATERTISLKSPRSSNYASVNQADSSGHEHKQELPVYPDTVIPNRIPVLSRDLVAPASATTIYVWDNPNLPNEALFANGDKILFNYFSEEAEIITSFGSEQMPSIVAEVHSGDTTAAATSRSITNPGTLQEGDKLLFMVAIQSSSTTVSSPPSGFTLEENSSQGGLTVYLYSKTATAGDVAAGSFSVTIDSAQGLAVGFVAIRNWLDSYRYTHSGTSVLAEGYNIPDSGLGSYPELDTAKHITLMFSVIDSYSTTINAPTGATKQYENGNNSTGDFISMALFTATSDVLPAYDDWSHTISPDTPSRVYIVYSIALTGSTSAPTTTTGRGFVQISGVVTSYTDLANGEQSYTFTPETDWEGDGVTIIPAETPGTGFQEAQNNSALIFNASGDYAPYILAATHTDPKDTTTRVPKVLLGNVGEETGNDGEITLLVDYIQFRNVDISALPAIPVGMGRLAVENGSLYYVDSGGALNLTS